MVFDTYVPNDQVYIPRTSYGRENMTNHLKPDPLIPPHGGYRDLKSYQMAEIVFDATMVFCDRFIDRRSRTCENYLSEHREREGVAPWALHVEGATRAPVIAQMIQAARSGKQNIAQGRMASGTSYKTYFEKAEPETAANTAISLIHQTNYLLDQQLRALEKTFLEEGGFTERLYRVRSQARERKK